MKEIEGGRTNKLSFQNLDSRWTGAEILRQEIAPGS